MKPQFNIRTLLVLTLFVAILAAWWVDRSKLQDRNDTVTRQFSELKLVSDQLRNQISELNLTNDKLRMQTSQSRLALIQLHKQVRLLEGSHYLRLYEQLQARHYELEFQYAALAKKVREEEGLDLVRLLFRDDDKAAEYSTGLYNQTEHFGVE